MTGQQKLLRALLIVWPAALSLYAIAIVSQPNNSVTHIIGGVGAVLFDVAILTTVAYGVSRLIAWLSPDKTAI